MNPATKPKIDLFLPSTQYPCVVVLLSICLGILFDRFWDFSWWVSVVLLTAGLAAWLVLWLVNCHRWSTVCLLIGVFGVATLWHHAWWNWYAVNEVGLWTGGVSQPVMIEVRQAAEPRRMAGRPASPLNAISDEQRTLIKTQALRIRDGRRWREVSGSLDVYVHGVWDQGSAGDILIIAGQLSPIEAARNPGEFDFQMFFRAQRNQAVLYVDFPEAISRRNGASNLITRCRAVLRRHLNKTIWQQVNAQNAGLASAILLGNRQQLTDDQTDLFMLSSTIHVLSISGLHVGILAGMLFWLMRFGLLSRRVCLIGVILLVAFYSWLVEFNPPVTRSAVLISLFCISRLTGRTGFSMNLLACAGIIVLAINPTDLFGLGPQLSFLAIVSMIGAAPNFNQRIDPLDNLILATRPRPVRSFIWVWRHVAEAFRISAVIWLVALPLVAARFHLVSPIGLLVNPLILIPMAFAMYFGMLVLLTGWWFPLLAQGVGWCCHCCLNLIVVLVQWSATVPGGHFWVIGPALFAIAIFYFGVWTTFVSPFWKVPARWLFTLSLAWVAIGWIIPQTIWRHQIRSPRDSCEFTFVDVGHGTSVLIHMPDGRHILYDAGSFGSSQFGIRSVSSVLRSEGIEHLDAVVISHADIDHFNALPELCRRFSIGVVYLSPQMMEDDVPSVRALLGALRSRSIEIRPIHSGMSLRADNGGEIACLGPPFFGTGGSDNSNSVVLLVSAFGRKVLLPGDLEDEGMDFLLEQPKLDCDVVMAPHHGSMGSRPQDFVKWSTPEWIAVSCARTRIDPRCISIYRSQGASTMPTATLGAIRIRIDSNGVSWQSWIEHGRPRGRSRFVDSLWQTESYAMESNLRPPPIIKTPTGRRQDQN